MNKTRLTTINNDIHNDLIYFSLWIVQNSNPSLCLQNDCKYYLIKSNAILIVKIFGGLYK